MDRATEFYSGACGFDSRRPLQIAMDALREIATGRNAAGEKVDFYQDIAADALAKIASSEQ